MSDENPARYCIDVILKEARLEDRLAKQLFYVMASAYTNNPLNLAINSPSGEGKNWVIKKAAEKFLEEDVIKMSGMTSKAIFHRRGVSVIKNDDTGDYEPLDDKLAEIDIRNTCLKEKICVSIGEMYLIFQKSYAIE